MARAPTNSKQRPPHHTRFKPGQSGNPKGRPKGSVNFRTLIERELRKTVVIAENGRQKRLTKQEVIVRRLAHDGIKGEYRAIELLMKLAGPEPAADHENADNAVTMPGRDALRTIARRLNRMIDKE